MNANGEAATGIGRSPAVVTMGESMVLLSAIQDGRLRYVDTFHRSYGGAESTFAIALARLGVSVGWVSRLGNDEFGAYIQASIRGEGVDVSQVVTDADRPTGVFFKEQSRFGRTEVSYYRVGSAASAMSAADVSESYLANARYLHMTGITMMLGPVTRDAAKTTIDRARALGAKVSFDANVRRKMASEDEWKELLIEVLPDIDTLFVTRSEAELIGRGGSDEDNIKVLLEAGPTMVVVKNGKEGALLGTPEGSLRQDALKVPGSGFQPHGAGDAFAAGLIAGELRGWPLERAAALAALLGASSTTVTGNIEGLPTASEVEEFTQGKERFGR